MLIVNLQNSTNAEKATLQSTFYTIIRM